MPYLYPQGFGNGARLLVGISRGDSLLVGFAVGRKVGQAAERTPAEGNPSFASKRVYPHLRFDRHECPTLCSDPHSWSILKRCATASLATPLRGGRRRQMGCKPGSRPSIENWVLCSSNGILTCKSSKYLTRHNPQHLHVLVHSRL
jgi:hypothetical protein